MRERHHAYNFHIGFWGAFLISLALIFHSAVLILASAGVGMAQTAPFLTVASPQAGQQFQQRDRLNFSATTSAAVPNLTVTAVNTAKGINDTIPVTQDGTFRNWSGEYELTQTGNYVITARATNPATGQISTVNVDIVVNTGVNLSVTMTSPEEGAIINAISTFEARVNATVDQLRFSITPTQTGGQEQFLDATTTDQVNYAAEFDPAAFAAGTYKVSAIGTVGQQSAASPSVTITVEDPADATTGSINLSAPLQGATISGTTTLRAESTVSIPGTSFNFQITPGVSSAFDLVAGTNPQNDGKTWQASLDTTQYTNGSYTIVAFGTIAGVSVPSNLVSVTISNTAAPAPTTGNPPAITLNALTAGQVGVPYNTLITSSGGTSPLTWSIASGALPTGLTLNSLTGAISGVPTQSGSFTVQVKVTDVDGRTAQKSYTLSIAEAPTTPAECGNGIEEPAAGETCDDGNTVSGDGCSSTCQREGTDPIVTDPTVTEPASTLAITSPAGGAILQGANIFVVVRGSEPINTPTIMLVNSNGQNVVNDSSSSFRPTNNEQGRIWHYRLDTTEFPNGNYSLRARANASDDNAVITATNVAVTINNPTQPAEEEAPTSVGGVVTRPRQGEQTSGQVLLQAQITGTDHTVVFNLQTPSDGTKTVNARYNASKNLYEATWDTTGIAPGQVSMRTVIETRAGQRTSLPTRTFTIVAQTAPVVVQPPSPTEPVPEPRPEEIIPPQVLENVDENGQLPTTPIECQIVRITDEEACAEYLRSRAIRVLDPQEQQQVRTDISRIVTKHIAVGEGEARSRDFGTAGTEENVDEPLLDILPVNRQRSSQSSFLVAPSTQPPENVRRFVPQTVEAVLISDRDGDGLSDDAEARYGSDPDNPDSDGDGFNDGQEVRNGFNPVGPGLLGVVSAPVDLAILNNRPLDQPRFAGRTEPETMQVDEVETPEGATEEEARIRLRGRAEPNAFVTLYIYSSLPLVVTVQADASGSWQYELDHPLVDGKHEVYATVTNETGKIVKKSRPLDFFVQSARAVSEEQFLQSNVVVEDTSDRFLGLYLMAGLLFVLLGAVLFFYYVRQKKAFG